MGNSRRPSNPMVPRREDASSCLARKAQPCPALATGRWCVDGWIWALGRNRSRKSTARLGFFCYLFSWCLWYGVIVHAHLAQLYIFNILKPTYTPPPLCCRLVPMCGLGTLRIRLCNQLLGGGGIKFRCEGLGLSTVCRLRSSTPWRSTVLAATAT